MGYVERMLGQHEQLVFRTHQHWITLVPSFVVNLLVLIAILILAVILTLPPIGIGPGWIAGVLVVFPIGRFIFDFLLWDNTEYLVTNRRVIQIDGVVNKNVTDSSLEKVNDVKMSQSVFGRMLDYGDVEILTASELAPNLFRRIQSPIKFKTVMLNQKEAMGTGEVGRGPAVPAEPDVPTMIEHLDELRKRGVLTEDEFQKEKQKLLEKM